jgi:hypothetical protein
MSNIDQMQGNACQAVHSPVFGGLTLENPQELREMAKRYRSMADVGQTVSRVWRLEFADYLERRADAIEALALVSGAGP